MKLINKLKWILLCAVILTTVSAGCKKDRGTQPKYDNSILGSWRPKGNTNIILGMEFLQDGSFEIITAAQGRANYTQLRGNFVVSGSNLKVNIKEHINRVNGESTVTQTSPTYELYENCTFKIKKNVLTLKYTSYPADAPVATTIEYERRFVFD